MPGNPFRGMLGDYLRAVQLKQQHEQFQQQHDLAQKQLDELTKFHQGEIDRMQAEMEHNRAVTAQTLRQHMVENIVKGYEQPPESAQPTGFQQNFQQPSSSDFQTDQSGNVQLPTGIPSSLSKTGSQFQLPETALGGFAKYLSPQDRTINVSTPEHLAAQAATAAGQKTAAEETAKAPFELAKTRELVGGRETVARIAAEQRAKTAEDRNAALLDRMNHIDATRKYVADHKIGDTIDEGELGNYVEQLRNGTADIKDLPQKFRLHANTLATRDGGVVLGTDRGKQLDALNDFDGLIQDMHTAANMLPDTVPGLQQLQQLGNVARAHMPWQTDLASAMAAVSAKAPGVVRAVGGVGSGRVTNVEIQQKLKDMVNAGMTKQQAEEKIANFERDTYTKLYSDILGPVPTQQKVATVAKHGGLDRWRGVNVKQKDGTVGPVIKKMSNGHEAMYNPNTDRYDDIEDYK